MLSRDSQQNNTFNYHCHRPTVCYNTQLNCLSLPPPHQATNTCHILPTTPHTHTLTHAHHTHAPPRFTSSGHTHHCHRPMVKHTAKLPFATTSTLHHLHIPDGTNYPQTHTDIPTHHTRTISPHLLCHAHHCQTAYPTTLAKTCTHYHDHTTPPTHTTVYVLLLNIYTILHHTIHDCTHALHTDMLQPVTIILYCYLVLVNEPLFTTWTVSKQM